MNAMRLWIQNELRQTKHGEGVTSTRASGLPLTLMIPFPALQWLTATCCVVKTMRGTNEFKRMLG